MAILKKIGVLSFAKLQAVLMAIFGLIAGVIYGFFGIVVGAIAGSAVIAGLGIVAIIVLPIMYGIFGFIGGAIIAFLYNLVAGWVGGIELEFEEIKK